MSSIVTTVLNLTVGFLRDYTANYLRDGDLTDEKCRQLIVRELDDIKTKLDGLARSYLLSSICFLKEALGFLSLSQNESADGETSFAQEHKQDIIQVEGATMMVAGCSSLSQAISGLNNASKERFTSAKISFEKSNTDATRAFSNEALSVEDRITATKLRVMSRILASLEDREAAIVACKGYLKELHDLPAVREMFSVQLSGGMKSVFNKTKRLENVTSVTMINFAVSDFSKKFSKLFLSHLFNWPTIKLDKREHNLMLLEGDLVKKVEEYGVRSPTQFTLKKEKRIIPKIYFPQVNSNGEMIGFVDTCRGHVYKFTAGESHLFFTLLQEDTDVLCFPIRSLAVDEEDNVYIVACSRNQTDDTLNFKVVVFDAKGNMKHQCRFLGVYSSFASPRIAVTTAMIVIYGVGKDVFVCDSSGQMKYSFRVEENVCLSISDKKEIIVAPRLEKVVKIYTEEGKLMKRFEVREDHCVRGLAFNHVTKEIIIVTEKSCIPYLLSYKSGELRGTFQLPLQYEKVGDIQITSHPCGSVALLCNEHVLYIQ